MARTVGTSRQVVSRVGRIRVFPALLLAFGVLGGTLLLGASPAAATTTTLYVAAGGTDSGSCTSSSTPCATGTYAVSQAASGDTIEMAGTIDDHVGVPVNFGSLTLAQWPGQPQALLDGTSSGTVLTVFSGDTVYVDQLTIEDGSATSGGGINNAGGNLTVTDSTFSNNHATTTTGGGGGGIFNKGGTVDVTSSTFSGNTANFGGAIDNADGGTATVTSSTFSGNTATANGGAIDNADESSNGTLTVTSSTFSGNTATANGGGIDNADESSNGTATITSSTFSGNGAYDGGAIDNGDGHGTGTLNVTSSTFSGNRANFGGGILNSNGTATLAADILAKATKGGECLGTMTDADYNIDDDGSCNFSAVGSLSGSSVIDAYLGTLSHNGGPTETIPLTASPTSPVGPDPALDAIPASFDLPNGGPAACSVPDQRGVPRFAPCDIGAYETHPANVATSVVVSGSASTTAPGTSVTYSATVVPTTDNEAGSGVTFFQNGSPVTCTGYKFNGQIATCTLDYSTPGTNTVTASYSGDTVFSPSAPSAPFTLTVSANPTTTTLTTSDSAPAVGESVTYTATVSATSVTGSVSFSDNGAPAACATAPSLASGVATCKVTYASAGSHVLSATYSGDATYSGSVSDPIAVEVHVTPTTTTLSTSDASPAPGQTLTLRASVAPTQSPGADGSVTFSVSGTPLSCGAGSSAFDGTSATCVTSFTDPGAYPVIATYSGDPAYGGSASPALLESVAVPNPGYWVAAKDGGIFSFGTSFYGSMGGQHLNAPIVGMAATPDGKGYWEVASDGGIFAFGDAGFFGSMGGQHLNAPVVGMASTPDGKGYWEVAADGGIFSFGDATFMGSMGGKHLNAPIVGMAATPDGGGYWEVAQDGGIFSLGDATFIGSAAAESLSTPVVGMAADPYTGGYWVLAGSGALFGFGAPFDGAFPDLSPASAAVAITAG